MAAVAASPPLATPAAREEEKHAVLFPARLPRPGGRFLQARLIGNPPGLRTRSTRLEEMESGHAPPFLPRTPRDRHRLPVLVNPPRSGVHPTAAPAIRLHADLQLISHWALLTTGRPTAAWLRQASATLCTRPGPSCSCSTRFFLGFPARPRAAVPQEYFDVRAGIWFPPTAKSLGAAAVPAAVCGKPPAMRPVRDVPAEEHLPRAAGPSTRTRYVFANHETVFLPRLQTEPESAGPNDRFEEARTGSRARGAQMMINRRPRGARSSRCGVANLNLLDDHACTWCPAATTGFSRTTCAPEASRPSAWVPQPVRVHLPPTNPPAMPRSRPVTRPLLAAARGDAALTGSGGTTARP